ncbi:MAG: DNA-3-methyladenine glycosylase 2 family protein [SAR202 cluster bacterium]|nr:DNA-3-methyladenine glycosylase 2 family protein [SAR202 cluster bacterium]
MRLEFPHPFDLKETLESGQAHRWKRYGQWYSGVVYGNLLHMRQDLFGVEVYSAPEKPEKLTPMLQSYFRLDDDLPAIYQGINKDSRIAEMIGHYPGMRLLRQEPWECLVAFICSATSNIPRIHNNMESIANTYGTPVTLRDETRSTFPSPQQVADAGETALRKLALGFRAKYLAVAARQVADGELNLESLRTMPYWEARARLEELPGIGAKIADCVLAFSLDKMEAFPIDRWVSRAMHEWYLNGKKMNYDDIVRWAHEYFGPYAGYAQQYLFQGKRLEKKVARKTST